MIAFAALLSVPAVVAAQSTPPANMPASPPASVRPMPTTSTNSADSTYVTSDQNVRASKVVGASVYNDQNQKIGSVDDVLIGSNDGVSGVVLSVGGFLGMDSKLVEVPYSKIQVNGDKLVMSGATKDDLTRLPEYKYKSNS
jgi:sporulation protein YlmC with PRC-barrel domain